MMRVAVARRIGSRLLWWRTPPGYVRISSKRLIALQRLALRARDLELEAIRLNTEAAQLEAAATARDLVDAQCRAAGVALTPQRTADLLQAIPQTPAGELHECAFLALVGNALVAQRLAASIPTIGDHR
jgi:hypothetical protein